MRKIIMMAILFTALAPPTFAGPTQLVEDYQVIQRDKNDKGACVVVIPQAALQDAPFKVTIAEESGQSIVQIDAAQLSDAGNGNQGVIIDNIPVGGPYTVEVSSISNSNRTIIFHRVLVGDIWLLAGQSNMYGSVPEVPRPVTRV